MDSRSFMLRSGQSLMEVVIATLIAAITSVAVFSVVLSSSVSQKRADKKEQIAMVLNQAQQTLQAYVSADVVTPVYSSAGTYYAPNLGGVWSADSRSSLMYPDSWALYGAPAPNGILHDISSLMNTPANIDLRRDSRTGAIYTCVYGGPCSLTYKVIDMPQESCLGGAMDAGSQQACKQVIFSIKYTD